MKQARWLDEREQCMWRSYRDMHYLLEAALEKDLTQDSGLSSADYSVLVPLSESPNGRLRPRELRAEAGWDGSRLAHQVRRMEKRGLLTREGCAEDARGTLVCITEAGRRAIEGAAPGHVESVRRYFIDHLSEAEIDTLSEISRKVIARVSQFDPRD